MSVARRSPSIPSNTPNATTTPSTLDWRTLELLLAYAHSPYRSPSGWSGQGRGKDTLSRGPRHSPRTESGRDGTPRTPATATPTPAPTPPTPPLSDRVVALVVQGAIQLRQSPLPTLALHAVAGLVHGWTWLDATLSLTPTLTWAAVEGTRLLLDAGRLVTRAGVEGWLAFHATPVYVPVGALGASGSSRARDVVTLCVGGTGAR
jgi:hypothetical protein